MLFVRQHGEQFSCGDVRFRRRNLHDPLVRQIAQRRNESFTLDKAHFIDPEMLDLTEVCATQSPFDCALLDRMHLKPR